MKGLWITLILLGCFWGVNELLVRPLPSATSSSAGSAIPQENGPKWLEPRANSERSPASVQSDVKIVQGMARFVSDHPGVLNREILEHDLRAPLVLGVHLDEKSIRDLETEEGMGKFRERFSNQSNLGSAVDDVHQAWSSVDPTDFTRREALLRVTGGLAGVSGDSELRGLMLKEFDSYHGTNLGTQNREYAGKALQEYLFHETDEAKKNEELKKRGIPIIHIPPREGTGQ